MKDPDFSRNMPGVDTRAPAVSLPGAVAREEKAKQSIGFDPAEVSSTQPLHCMPGFVGQTYLGAV